jgi:hypothetical protein
VNDDPKVAVWQRAISVCCARVMAAMDDLIKLQYQLTQGHVESALEIQ